MPQLSLTISVIESIRKFKVGALGVEKVLSIESIKALPRESLKAEIEIAKSTEGEQIIELSASSEGNQPRSRIRFSILDRAKVDWVDLSAFYKCHTRDSRNAN